jgi:hypothetical protein
MALKNPPVHLKELLDNMEEVLQLLKIHGEFAGIGPGRKHDVEVLNKSAIVLLVACWEAYVEDLVKSTLEFLIDKAADHAVFPKNVLERVASKNSGINSWNLAGAGWKKALSDNLAEVLAKTIGTLNTPKTAQVDELFSKTLGHNKLSSCWAWPGRSVLDASKALDDLVTLRGTIAHRVKHSKSVRKKHVEDAIDLVSRLATKSNNEMCSFVHKLVGKYPWDEISYKGTS